MDGDDEINTQLAENLRNTALAARIVSFVTKDVANYFSPPRFQDPDDACKSWILKPEVPTSEEIFGADGEFVDLEPNKLEGSWSSKDAYLKAHYELLREDAVAPLRDAVAIFQSDPEMNDNGTVAIYEKVYIIGMTFARRGLAFRLRFSTNRAGRNIAWEYSKRLVTGSVVALSPADDAFKSKCVVAVIAARPLDGVKLCPPEVDVFFANPADANFDPQLEWVMVEAKQGYYEALRHTMTALQKLNQEEFSLSHQICSLEQETTPPDYVKSNPVMEIYSAFHDLEGTGKIDVLNDWPKSPHGDLDATQWAALEQMLTRKLAIIQGPPGTGKTYVSVLALKIMLSNMKSDDPPIIVASQTNHALDQLLTHISQFEKQYVRLGARSSDLEIKKRTLFAVRRDEPTPNLAGSSLGNSRKRSKSLFKSISELLQPFSEAVSHAPLASKVFKQHGLLTAKQCETLEQGAKRWVNAGDKDDEFDPMGAWLGDQVLEFEVRYTAENFGFIGDEVDLEYEQLKELEAEQGLNDDDEWEALKGTYVNLREGFIGKGGLQSRGPGRDNHLNGEDMWKIPVKHRGSVYNELRRQLKLKVLRDFREFLVHYAENCRNIQIGGWERDHLILQNAKVIGMTTTGLSKYRALVSSLKPRIVLIEEAAEAIEGPIAVACLDSLQQLILVGDHQQLRGHCAVQDLEGEPFNLDVSMFERLVRNGIRYVTLQRQRRMAPEIRQLLTPIYGELQDHVSVKEREAVPGMGILRSFLFSHEWSETFDEMSSKYNEKEADMVVEFFVYLVLNNVPVKNITVLTFYNGQRKRILKLLKKHSYLQGYYVKVVTVDSYQGEENDVVILSLVRNGAQGMGFLSVANRVCVALSRARRGFYMFGNKELLAANDLWARVLHALGNINPEPRIGDRLPLTCVKHNRRSYVKDASDLKKLDGGCELICGEKLICGHKCSMRCHSFSHDQVQCNEICNRKMACKHICKETCSASHSCSCDCAESLHLASLAEQQANQGRYSYSFITAAGSPEKEQDSERRAAVKGYQDYATGGAKEHDAYLDQMAELKQRTQSEVMVDDDDVFGLDALRTQSGPAALDGQSGENFSQPKPNVVPVGDLLDLW